MYYIYDRDRLAMKIDKYAAKHGLKSIHEVERKIGVSKGLFYNIYNSLGNGTNDKTIEILQELLGIVPYVDYVPIDSYKQMTTSCLVDGELIPLKEWQSKYERKLVKKEVQVITTRKNDVIHKEFPGFNFIKEYPHFNMWEFEALNGAKFKVCIEHNVEPYCAWKSPQEEKSERAMRRLK